MAAGHGKIADFTIGTDVATLIGEWSFTGSNDMSEVTGFTSAGKREYIPGQQGYTATASGYMDWGDTAQAALKTAFLNQTSVTAKLYTGAATYWSGTAYVSELGNSANINDPVAVSFSIQYTGAVTYT